MTHLFTVNCTLLLLAAFLPMTHSFYILLRIVVCGTLILSTIKAKKAHTISDPAEYIILTLFIVTYNPIFPLHRDAETWATLNILTASYLHYLIFNIRGKK